MANILVVEDEQLIAGLLKMTLEIEGYQTITVLNGEDAVQFALRETPHLIILDIMLKSGRSPAPRLPFSSAFEGVPEVYSTSSLSGSQAAIGIDGFEVVRRLREHPKTTHIPIIVLSALGALEAKVRAFELGVDDYITKPFHTEELLARLRTQLRRVQQNFLSPLVGLPGGLQVEMAIKYQLDRLEPWSILYLDLDNFKAFNDVYGFLAGNDLIRLVGRICQRMVRDYGNPTDFVGHIGGDDFVVVTTPECADTLCLQIIEHYKQESLPFYRAEDLKRGSISAVDRKGRPYQFPLVSLSIGVVNNPVRRLHSIQEISYLAAAAKNQAKQSTNNIYYISPRRDLTRYEATRHQQPPYTGQLLSSPFMPPALANIAYNHPYHDLYMIKDDDVVITPQP
jgi:diguanylate cyclase (GGDEF)-like protein